MNDTYVEVMVARKKNPFLGAARIILYALALICFLLSLKSGLFLVGTAVFAALAFFYLPTLDIEYEYLYIDKEISIDKIMSKEKRKHVYTVDLNKMDVMAPVNSHELDSHKARGAKVHDYTSGNEDAKVYSIVYAAGNEGTVLVNIEPNEEMLRAIKNVFPRKVLEV